jgi:hypothetical protein
MLKLTNGAGTLTATGATFEAVSAAHIRICREPWREYAPWRPDDMPPRNGCKRALARLADELGELDAD